MTDERTPIRVTHVGPIRVTHTEPIRVRPSSPVKDEPIVVGPPIFLSQETAEKRGVNSCVPTSFVNAAIGLHLINPNDGFKTYERIMQDLLAERDLWDGANLHVHNTNDPRLAEIVERHLPVRVGFESKTLGRMMLVPRSFEGIRNELVNGTAHVITNNVARHAYTSIAGYPDKFFYIDPMQASYYRQVNSQSFEITFNADTNGWATAILINPKTL